MKKRICFVLILCISLFVFSPVHAQQRKSVAVVLSGGGAKGVAHIGALKVIEEAGIPIDYIVGTSMGPSSAGFIPSVILPISSIAWSIIRIGLSCSATVSVGKTRP